MQKKIVIVENSDCTKILGVYTTMTGFGAEYNLTSNQLSGIRNRLVAANYQKVVYKKRFCISMMPLQMRVYNYYKNHIRL